MGFYMNPLTMNMNNYTIDPNLKTDDMCQSLTNSTIVYLYGVSTQLLSYWTFNVNLASQVVTIINQTVVSAPQLNGNQTTSLLGYSYYSVGCPDCSQPAIYIFDKKDLKLVTNFTVPAQPNDPINLAIYQDTRYTMQLFLGTRQTVDLIQMQIDPKGNVNWNYN